MENIKYLSDDIAIATNQPESTSFEQAAQAGFKSVLNLRSPQEEGALADEKTNVEQAGLTYAQIPVKPSDISDELTDRVMQTLDELPKPVLAHCKSGMRSGAMALMYEATRNGMSADAALKKGKENGFDCDAHPQMKQFFIHYIDSHTDPHASA
nr:protein tyrosine phosphatase family protein [Leptolyngbya sp. KIOST-1]